MLAPNIYKVTQEGNKKVNYVKILLSFSIQIVFREALNKRNCGGSKEGGIKATLHRIAEMGDHIGEKKGVSHLIPDAVHLSESYHSPSVKSHRRKKEAGGG